MIEEGPSIVNHLGHHTTGYRSTAPTAHFVSEKEPSIIDTPQIDFCLVRVILLP